MLKKLIIKGLALYRTSSACPEQYDVFFEGDQIGYLRLRHGSFTASYPDHKGAVVYSAYTAGDGLFEDYERVPQLTSACKALLAYHNKSVLESCNSSFD